MNSFFGYFDLRKCFLFLLIINYIRGRDIDYFPTLCNGKGSTTTSRWLESSITLAYPNDVSCTYEITVSPNKQVLAIFQRFELETKLNGACVDYVELHDGSGTGAPKLTTEPLCGLALPVNHTSSGNVMTLYFKTDNSGIYHGFTLTFVEINTVPCTSGQFRCNASICISDSLKCDTFNQCGDESDESDCSTTDETILAEDNRALILGTTFGILGFVMIVTGIVYYVYNRNKWRRFLADHVDDEDIRDDDPSYPVTNIYFKGRRGHPKYNTIHDDAAQNDENEKVALPVPPITITPSPSTSMRSLKT